MVLLDVLLIVCLGQRGPARCTDINSAISFVLQAAS
jgi:hypothetical protein